MLSLRLWLIVLLMFFCGYAADFKINGFIDSRQSFAFKEPHSLISSRTRLRIESRFSHSDAWAFASVNAVYNGVVKNETGLTLREAYVGWACDFLDFQMGNQIIIWGKSDGLTVTDNVSPKDYSEALARDFDDMRIPVTSVKLRTFFGNLTMELLWLPLFKPSILPYKQEGVKSKWSANPWAYSLPAGITVHEAEEPSFRLKKSEFGGRLTINVSALDLSFSGLYTWDDEPLMEIKEDGFYPSFYRVTVAGIDAAVPVSFLVIRAEAALFINKHLMQDRGDSKKGELFKYLAGIDITPGNDWNISLQLYNETIVNYKASYAGREHDPFATLSVSKEFLRNTLAVSAMGFFGIKEKEAYLQASAEYALSDALKLALGTDIFYGDEGTLGGYSDNSSGYLKCKFSF